MIVGCECGLVGCDYGLVDCDCGLLTLAGGLGSGLGRGWLGDMMHCRTHFSWDIHSHGHPVQVGEWLWVVGCWLATEWSVGWGVAVWV